MNRAGMDFEAVCRTEAVCRAEDYSPAVLAYLGDAVFELYVRSMLISGGNQSVRVLNEQARKLVKAGAQAQMYHRLADCLTNEEQAVLRRGRNSKTAPTGNATVSDYRHATGLEALFGYLFIKGEYDRLSWLFSKCVEGEQNGQA